EPEEDRLYKGRRYSEDETGKGYGRYWISLVTLVLVGLGLLCTALVFGVLLPDQSGVEITMADTLAAFHVPKTPTPRITLPSDEPGRVGRQHIIVTDHSGIDSLQSPRKR
ncbi:hypothetical protein MTO96_038391, partial [Rhipicephalus appendiculatus]